MVKDVCMFQVFLDLSNVYVENLRRLYTKEVADFLESAKQRLHAKDVKGKVGKYDSQAISLYLSNGRIYLPQPKPS